jgi:hypothetical protein
VTVMDQAERDELRARSQQRADELRAEITRRQMTEPLPDAGLAWRERASEREREFAAARRIRTREYEREREKRSAAAQPQPPDMSAVKVLVEAELTHVRAVMSEAVGTTLGQEIESLRREFTSKLAERDNKLKAERLIHMREINTLRQELASARASHAADLGRLVRDIQAVANSVNQLGTAINGKKMDELREDFANGFARLRTDISNMN